MNNAYRILLAVVAVMSVMDVIKTQHHSEDEHDTDAFHEFDDDAAGAGKYAPEAPEQNDDEGIEIRDPSAVPRSDKPFAVPSNLPPLRFAFCVSCGYRQAFDQFSQIISEKYPGIQIEGANFPPGQLKALLAQFIGIAKIALIVMIVMGRDPFTSLGMATPGVYTWMIGNKLSACLMLFMLSNALEGMLMSSGAFEIYLGKEKIWSKLESGRVPSPAELVQAIDSHLAIGGAKIGEGFGFDDM
jgi:selT/selW/selH-like putative selenoprotein